VTTPTTASAEPAPDRAPAPPPDGAADAASAGPGRLRFHWPVLVLTALFLAATSFFWYRNPWFGPLHHHRVLWYSQPAFVALATVVFFGILRAFTGIRWRDVSRDGRFVLISALALFSLLWWFGRTGSYERYFHGLLPDSPLEPLYGFFYFSLNCFLARTLLPIVLIRTRLRGRARDFGYRRPAFRLWWVYLTLAAVVIAVVWFYASLQPAFQAKYPMARRLLEGDTRIIPVWQFLAYQAAYGLIFVSGESFWRGYIAFGLERDIRWYGLVFMIIPYTMAHYGKPLSETMGAMLTGMVLGYLALRERSFWLGVAAHWSVAIAMDVSALIRVGYHLTW